MNAPATEPYKGFEQGPIRPPSEANSLLIRVTRNCPWNRCTFCPVYKRRKFSLRYPEHVKQDIDAVHKCVSALMDKSRAAGHLTRQDINDVMAHLSSDDMGPFQAAVHWFAGGLKSIFIQDANSLIIKPDDLIGILKHLRNRFPWVERITSYARSHTVARIPDDKLKAMREAGLNRIHIGMESGSDTVLKLVKKGVTKATHVKAGLKVKAAGMELSEYVMPGLGGRQHSREHALETADAVNQIDPHFIRLRTLALPGRAELAQTWHEGKFEKCTDVEMAEETLLFLENLDGITSVLKSDHILNLFEDLEGKFPEDKEKMTGMVRAFLDMSPQRRTQYQVGRRIGVFRGISDMESPHRLRRADEIIREMDITPDNVDAAISELMKRFV